MHALRLLLIAILGLLGASGQLAASPVPQDQEPEAAPAHPGEGEHGQGAHKSTLEMSFSEMFAELHGHSVPHVVWPHVEHGERAPAYSFYNVNQWQVIALVLVLLLMANAASSFGKPGRPGFLTRVCRGWCRWIRDEMVYAVMGKEEGRKWVPFFLFLFFFIAGMNVVGLLPSITGVLEVSTATSTPYVTGPLAVITLLLMLGFGMRQNGVLGFVKGLLPHGLPVALLPLMLVVEIVGLVVKPFALMIRLFANMLAGHLVIASMIGLIFVFTKMFGGSVISYGPALLATGMAAFIYIIESFIVLLQAYIFTYLSIIFLQQAIHQQH
jgi:F-type H+-transporting ATPase subunit a